MKLSLRWIGRHVDLSGIEPKQILADLTMSTAEIEGLERFGDGLECLVVGHVVACAKHPDADKLTVCQVLLGAGAPATIVCGAPNVRQGQKVVVIRPGDSLPSKGGKGALKIKVGKIRGVESHGMICSEQELGLSEDHDGIIVLPDNAPVGARFVDVAPVQDWVLEIDNKSINHRPDLWGHYGFARELAAIYGRDLAPPAPPQQWPTTGRAVAVQIDDPVGCPRYCGLVLDGVQVGRSPDELRYLLAAVGQRAINLPVDLTNFVMLDLGQPLHAFDLQRLHGRAVHVRRARAGEQLVTLDAVSRKLTDQDLLICAGDEPVALAGIMGGAGTMVAAGTQQLFLESAAFHAATVRRTSMRLSLRTDASARFEKAQDPANAETAVRLFVHLLQRYCPTAKVAGPLADPAGFRYAGKTIRLRRQRLALKLGVALPDAQVTAILTSLHFGVAPASDGFDVAVPSFRATKDIAIEDDLIEEVGRMFRYDNIPEQPLTSVVTPPPRVEELFLVRALLQIAAGDLATCEAYNYSFVPDAVLAACLAGGQQYAQVKNPVAPEVARIRRHVLPSLLSNVRGNLRHVAEVRLVEQGKGYHPEVRDGHDLPTEVRELAFVWSRSAGAHPYAELREAVAWLLRRAGYPSTMARSYSSADQPWVHPKAAVAIDRDGSPVGFVAHLHPHVARNLELPSTTAIACIDVRALLRSGRRSSTYTPLPTFPELPVDVAIAVPEATQVVQVADFLRRIGRKLVRSVELFEVYRGQGVAAGNKSLNFTVTLGADDRTLAEADEASYLDKVRQGAAEIGGEMRG
jgi:phenylalanyl-tRNA synthetase beta chain